MPTDRPGVLHPRRLLPYVVVGVWNTLFGWLSYVALLYLGRGLGVHYVVWIFPTFLIATGQAWYTQGRFVFPESRLDAASYLRFLGVYGGAGLLNLGALPLLVETTGLAPEWSQLLITPAMPPLTYLANYFITYRAHAAE